MVKPKDGDAIKSSALIREVQTRPCLFDSNHPHYGDRAEKSKCWEDVCASVVPAWRELQLAEKIAASKEVQKRWRSIRDSYTKAFRQGKCLTAAQCAPGSRRYHYHSQMSFLLKALQNKKQRYSQEKYEPQSEVSMSPQHLNEDIQKTRGEIEKPLDLKTRPDQRSANATTKPTFQPPPEPTERLEGARNPSLEIKIDTNTILPEDNLDDDRLFMTSLIPLFRKMDDDTRLLCRIEVLRVVRHALQGSKCFEALKIAEDSLYKDRVSSIVKAAGSADMSTSPVKENSLSMVTRSADGSRPVRKRQLRSPSPLSPPKRRGPGRPRKIRPPSDCEEEISLKKKMPKLKVSPVEVHRPSQIQELDDSFSKATSVTQLSTPMFMKMYNLERSKIADNNTQTMQVSIKTEPLDADS